MAFDQTPDGGANGGSDFLKQLSDVFAEGDLTKALREDLQVLSAMSDADLTSKGLTRSRVERAVRRKHIQSLYS